MQRLLNQAEFEKLARSCAYCGGHLSTADTDAVAMQVLEGKVPAGWGAFVRIEDGGAVVVGGEGRRFSRRTTTTTSRNAVLQGRRRATPALGPRARRSMAAAIRAGIDDGMKQARGRCAKPRGRGRRAAGGGGPPPAVSRKRDRRTIGLRASRHGHGRRQAQGRSKQVLEALGQEPHGAGLGRVGRQDGRRASSKPSWTRSKRPRQAPTTPWARGALFPRPGLHGRRPPPRASG